MATTGRKAWIKGLPGHRNRGDIQVELIRVVRPSASNRRLLVFLRTGRRLVAGLRAAASQARPLSRFSVVVRVDQERELDREYRMFGVRVSLGATSSFGLAVTFTFQSITIVAGISIQPGPPFGAPAVRDAELNPGWAYGPGPGGPTALTVVGFSPPGHGTMRVLVRIRQGAAARLARAVAGQNLVLVLPNRRLRRYVEAKLSTPSVAVRQATAKGGACEIRLQSPYIEYLTGSPAEQPTSRPGRVSRSSSTCRRRVSY